MATDERLSSVGFETGPCGSEGEHATDCHRYAATRTAGVVLHGTPAEAPEEPSEDVQLAESNDNGAIQSRELRKL